MAWLWTLLIGLSLIIGPVPADAASAAKVNVGLRDVIAAVEEQFTPERSTGLPPLQDVTADFVQVSTLAEKGREMRASGEMFFKTQTSTSPLMFRFDYFGPTNQQIVSNGRTMWIYLPANRQVIQSDVSFIFNPFSNTGRTRGVNFLQGLGRLSQDFRIAFSSQRQDIEGNYILELEPQRRMDTIAKLFIVVSRDAVLNRADSGRFPLRQELAFPIRSTTVVDLQGNTTIMEFSNIRANTGIPYSYFDFVPPPDAQVAMPPTGR